MIIKQDNQDARCNAIYFFRTFDISCHPFRAFKKGLVIWKTNFSGDLIDLQKTKKSFWRLGVQVFMYFYFYCKIKIYLYNRDTSAL